MNSWTLLKTLEVYPIFGSETLELYTIVGSETIEVYTSFGSVNPGSVYNFRICKPWKCILYSDLKALEVYTIIGS